jgi:hypothetical protein
MNTAAHTWSSGRPVVRLLDHLVGDPRDSLPAHRRTGDLGEMRRDLRSGQTLGIQRQHHLVGPAQPALPQLRRLCGSKVPARSRGTSISACPVFSVATVLGWEPLRTLPDSDPGPGTLLMPQVLGQFNAVSSTDLVNCFIKPSGPVSELPGKPHKLLAASAAADSPASSSSQSRPAASRSSRRLPRQPSRSARRAETPLNPQSPPGRV